MAVRGVSGGLLAAFALIVLPFAAMADTVTTTRADCQRLVNYVPSSDVAYQPGKDAYGRPVAPADLGGGSDIKAPDVISFDVQVNLRNFQRGPEADAQAHSAAVAASNKAANAATLALTTASTAESAAAANPGNQPLADAAAATRAAATAANAAVTAGDKSAAATNAATSAAAASAALPSDPDLAQAAQDLNTAAQDASQANTALNQKFRSAERIGQYLGQPVVGHVTVTQDQVFFNGKPLMDQDQAEFTAACRKALATPAK